MSADENKAAAGRDESARLFLTSRDLLAEAEEAPSSRRCRGQARRGYAASAGGHDAVGPSCRGLGSCDGNHRRARHAADLDPTSRGRTKILHVDGGQAPSLFQLERTAT